MGALSWGACTNSYYCIITVKLVMKMYRFEYIKQQEIVRGGCTYLWQRTICNHWMYPTYATGD